MPAFAERSHCVVRRRINCLSPERAGAPVSPKRRSRAPDRVRWAIEQLALAPTDRVLEIGSGSGLAVALAAERLTRGCITAIDRSALQVKQARALNRNAIAAGRARVERLSLEQAPDVFGNGGFAKVFAINVNAFWTTPTPSLACLRRLVQ